MTLPCDPTELLRAWSRGEGAARDRLLPLVYDELRRVAARCMRNERAGNTLQATALVNEVYLRLVDAEHVDVTSRAHFFALVARMMRRLLVDSSRARGSIKRGRDIRKVSLDEASAVVAHSMMDFSALDDALNSLATIHPRKVEVVELRYFGGLSIEESAAALGVSIDTVKRDWRFAKAWLSRELRAPGPTPLTTTGLSPGCDTEPETRRSFPARHSEPPICARDGSR